MVNLVFIEPALEILLSFRCVALLYFNNTNQQNKGVSGSSQLAAQSFLNNPIPILIYLLILLPTDTFQSFSKIAHVK